MHFLFLQALVGHSDSETEGHDQGHSDSKDHHQAVYLGLISLGGMYFFFVTERLMALLSERKRRKTEKVGYFFFLCNVFRSK